MASSQIGLFFAFDLYGMNFSTVLSVLFLSFASQAQVVDLAEIQRLWSSATSLTAKGETIGVEVEGVLPGSSDWDVSSRMRSEVVRILESLPGITKVAPHPYANFVEFDFNNRTHQFSIKRDGTIRPPPGFFGIEVTSPIMHDNDEIDIFTHIVGELNSRLAYSPEPSSTGLHVHLGFKDSSDEEKKLALLMFELLESHLYDRFKPNIGRTSHLISVVGQTQRWIESGLDFQGFLKRIHGEYRNIRMSHLKNGDYGTLETRFFNSTTNKQEIIEAVNLVRTLVKKIRLRDPLLLKMLIGEVSPKEFLNASVPARKFKCEWLFAPGFRS